MPIFQPGLDQILDGAPPVLEPLLRWLLTAAPDAHDGGEAPRTVRLRTLQQELRARGLAGAVADAWGHTSAIRLLSETGLPDRTSLFGEGLLRLVDQFIPRLDPEGDLYALLDRLDLDEADARWIETLPADLAATWGGLLQPPPVIWGQAARLLAHRATAIGLSRDILGLGPQGSDADSPFFTLSRVVEQRVEGPGDPAARAAWDASRAACSALLEQVHLSLETRGVSTDLVFRLELLEAQLERIGQLLAFAAGEGGGRAFAASLVRGSASQHSVRTLIRTAIKRLARKMVEHTGDTGEHYIAQDRSEWRAMGWSAAGGGLLTAGTALLKYGFSALPLAPLILSVALVSNYALSFCIMQLLCFSLASKQPAMTAAALARALEEAGEQAAEIELMAAITRTQVIATVGNVLAAMATSLAISALWIALSGHGALGPATALHSLHGNHPFHGGTLVYAAATGVLLWLSSLASGWAANWSDYRQLPQALARSHRVRALLGPGRAAALGEFVHHNIAGFAGYLALGTLLVFVPLAFAFAGIHLEMRHVTLQSASLALAAASLWAQGALPWGEAAWGLLGVALIGAVNFTVSFALALWTAFRARDLRARTGVKLFQSLLRTLNREPGRFLIPPAKPSHRP